MRRQPFIKCQNFYRQGWATSYYEKDFGYLGHYFVFFEKWGGMWHRQNWRQKTLYYS